MWIRVAGREYHGEHNEVHYREVTPRYFNALGARLLRGRYFRQDDDASKPPVLIVNQTFARKYFADQDPLTQQLLYAPPTTQPSMAIVGIVDDIKEASLDSANAADHLRAVRAGSDERLQRLRAHRPRRRNPY